MPITPFAYVPKDLREWTRFMQQAIVQADANASISESDIPSTIARDTEVTNAVLAHKAETDPHPTYTTAAEVASTISAASISESQITNSAILARVADNETITGVWAFSLAPKLPAYTVATLPSAATYTRGMIYVSDETGGATVAFSDGTNWRRVQDRAVVA
jgi:hypothetical protein